MLHDRQKKSQCLQQHGNLPCHKPMPGWFSLFPAFELWFSPWCLWALWIVWCWYWYCCCPWQSVWCRRSAVVAEGECLFTICVFICDCRDGFTVITWHRATLISSLNCACDLCISIGIAYKVIYIWHRWHVHMPIYKAQYCIIFSVNCISKSISIFSKSGSLDELQEYKQMELIPTGWDFLNQKKKSHLNSTKQPFFRHLVGS